LPHTPRTKRANPQLPRIYKREEWIAPHNMRFMGPQCELGCLLPPLPGSAYEAFTMSYHVTNVCAN
jgi:hypothetical protein